MIMVKGLFKYQPPSGFLALCDDNLPTPTIADPGKQFKTVIYTADDSSSGHSITGVGFKPDFDLVKRKNKHKIITSFGTILLEVLENVLISNVTNGYESYSTGYLSSFDENGFSIGGNNFVNDNGQDYVAWCWKAGGPAVSNNDGSITTQVSVNQTAGFSIVTWLSNAVGSIQTLGHGLGKTPDFMILKNRDYAYEWWVWHKDLSDTTRGYLRLSSNDAEQTGGNDNGLSDPTTFGFLNGKYGKC